MTATMGCLHRAGEHRGFSVLETGILRQTRQPGSIGDTEVRATQVPVDAVQLSRCPPKEPGLILSLEASGYIDTPDTRIEPEQRHGEIGVGIGEGTGDLVGEPGRCVHRHRDGDAFGPAHVDVGQLVYCQVDSPDFVS
jgi:hypothetical protein